MKISANSYGVANLYTVAQAIPPIIVQLVPPSTRQQELIPLQRMAPTVQRNCTIW